MIEKLKREILKASKELNSNELVYETLWWFELPSHSLKILDVELFNNYDIQSGLDGVGEKELRELEKIGFLKKVSEIVNDKDDLEKVIKYLINSESKHI